MRNSGFIRDAGTNKLSATRLVMVIWFLGVLAVWAYISITEKAVQPVPQSVATVLGFLVGAKAVQRFGEN